MWRGANLSVSKVEWSRVEQASMDINTRQGAEKAAG